MSWQKTDLVRRLGDKRLAGERQPVFLALLDSSVTAEIGSESKAATFTRNSAQYGRTLTGLASFAVDVPAIETFLDGAGSTVRGYLSEGERTNEISDSHRLSLWTIEAGVTVDADAAVAPDGSATADRVSVSGGAGIYSVTVCPSGQSYAPSVWIKKITSAGILEVQNPLGSGFGRWQIDFSALGSGWERITSRHPAVSAISAFRGHGSNLAGLYLLSSDAMASYLVGAQGEIAMFETSDIATTGSSAVRAPTLLRYAGGRNVCDGPSPRTYICRFVCPPGRSGYLWSISDGGSAADRIYATIEPSTGRARVRTAISAGATGDVTGTSDLADGEEHEVIVQLAANNLRLIVDGAAEGTPDATVAIPQNLDRWDVGADESGANHLNGDITYLQCSKGLVLA